MSRKGLEEEVAFALARFAGYCASGLPDEILPIESCRRPAILEASYIKISTVSQALRGHLDQPYRLVLPESADGTLPQLVQDSFCPELQGTISL